MDAAEFGGDGRGMAAPTGMDISINPDGWCLYSALLEVFSPPVPAVETKDARRLYSRMFAFILGRIMKNDLSNGVISEDDIASLRYDISYGAGVPAGTPPTRGYMTEELRGPSDPPGCTFKDVNDISEGRCRKYYTSPYEFFDHLGDLYTGSPESAAIWGDYEGLRHAIKKAFEKILDDEDNYDLLITEPHTTIFDISLGLGPPRSNTIVTLKHDGRHFDVNISGVRYNIDPIDKLYGREGMMYGGGGILSAEDKVAFTALFGEDIRTVLSDQAILDRVLQRGGAGGGAGAAAGPSIPDYITQNVPTLAAAVAAAAAPGGGTAPQTFVKGNYVKNGDPPAYYQIITHRVGDEYVLLDISNNMRRIQRDISWESSTEAEYIAAGGTVASIPRFSIGDFIKRRDNTGGEVKVEDLTISQDFKTLSYKIKLQNGLSECKPITEIDRDYEIRAAGPLRIFNKGDYVKFGSPSSIYRVHHYFGSQTYSLTDTSNNPQTGIQELTAPWEESTKQEYINAGGVPLPEPAVVYITVEPTLADIVIREGISDELTLLAAAAETLEEAADALQQSARVDRSRPGIWAGALGVYRSPAAAGAGAAPAPVRPGFFSRITGARRTPPSTADAAAAAPAPARPGFFSRITGARRTPPPTAAAAAVAPAPAPAPGAPVMRRAPRSLARKTPLGPPVAAAAAAAAPMPAAAAVPVPPRREDWEPELNPPPTCGSVPIVTGDCVDAALQKDISDLKVYLQDNQITLDDPQMQKYLRDPHAKFPDGKVIVRLPSGEMKTMPVTNPYKARRYRYLDTGVVDFAHPEAAALDNCGEEIGLQQNVALLRAIAPTEVVADKRFATAILESLWHCSSSQDLQNDPKCFPARILGELRLHKLYKEERAQQAAAMAILGKTDVDLVLDIARQMVKGARPPQRPGAAAGIAAGTAAIAARGAAEALISGVNEAQTSKRKALLDKIAAKTTFDRMAPTAPLRVTAAKAVQATAEAYAAATRVLVEKLTEFLTAVQAAATAGAVGGGLSVSGTQAQLNAATASVAEADREVEVAKGKVAEAEAAAGAPAAGAGGPLPGLSAAAGATAAAGSSAAGAGAVVAAVQAARAAAAAHAIRFGAGLPRAPTTIGALPGPGINRYIIPPPAAIGAAGMII